jgi:hypothetical protein
MSFKAFVICLDKTRARRCDPSLKQLQNHPFISDLYESQATTPDDFDNEDYAHPHALGVAKGKRRPKLIKNTTNKIHTAVVLSHIKLWKKCVELNEPIIICEDDIEPAAVKNLSDLRNRPADADLFIARCNCHIMCRTESTAAKNIVRFTKFAGAQCYWLTPHAARTFLKQVVPINMHADFWMSDCVTGYGLNAYGSSNATMSIAEAFISDDGSTLSHDFAASEEMQWIILTIILSALLFFMSLAFVITVPLILAHYQGLVGEGGSSSQYSL